MQQEIYGTGNMAREIYKDNTDEDCSFTLHVYTTDELHDMTSELQSQIYSNLRTFTV